MANNYLLSRPTLQGTMGVSPAYNVMGVGLTDTILLIGHADAQIMYNPYQVLNIQEAVDFLRGDSTSPLLRALLEAYNNGCKDIWLYPAAPMSEYISTPSDRFTVQFTGGKNFYQLYYDRLTAAYSVLINYDLFHWIVPVEAVHYDTRGVDFTTQLVSHCSTVFLNTGACSLGILGTRVVKDVTTAITELTTDSRLTTVGDAGKFVMIVIGEGLITNPQLSTSYSGTLATQIATTLATAPLNRSVAGVLLPHVASLTGLDYTDQQLNLLTQAKLNPAVRSFKAKRGLAYQNKLITDNTLAKNNSDYWSMGQMRLVAMCLNQIREYGYTFIGTLNSDLFKEAVYKYMDDLYKKGYVRDYSVDVVMSNSNTKATVNVSLFPILGIRNIFFNVVTGPGA